MDAYPFKQKQCTENLKEVQAKKFVIFNNMNNLLIMLGGLLLAISGINFIFSHLPDNRPKVDLIQERVASENHFNVNNQRLEENEVTSYEYPNIHGSASKKTKHIDNLNLETGEIDSESITEIGNIIENTTEDSYGNFLSTLKVSTNGFGESKILSTSPIQSYETSDNTFGCPISQDRFISYGEEIVVIREAESENMAMSIKCQYDQKNGYQLESITTINEQLSISLIQMNNIEN